MFRLKEDPSELAASDYVGQRYLQVPCTRDLTLDNFPRGTQIFRWETSGTTWVDFSKSFFRVRGTWSRADGSQLRTVDGIAPAMGTCANLYQSMEFRMAGTVVSRVSDFVAQTDALEVRSTRGRQWLDTVGASSNFYQASFADRQAQIVNDGPAPILGAPVASLAFGFDAADTIAIATVAGVSTITFVSGLAPVIPVGSVLTVLNGGVLSTLRITAQNTPLVYLGTGYAAAANLAATPLGAGVLRISIASPALPPALAPVSSAAFSMNAGTTVAIALPGTLTLSAPENLIPDGYIVNCFGQSLEILSSNSADGVKATIYTVKGATANEAAQPLVEGRLTIQGLANNSLLDAQQAGAVEMIWQPPLSIFRVDNCVPCGQFEIHCSPQIDGVYQKRSIESIGANKVAGTDFRFVVNDMYFWACTMESERVENKVYLLDLLETRCQPQLLPNSTGYVQKQFDISPSTVNVSLAVQASNAGTDSRLPATMFKALNGTDLNLSRIMIQYAGKNSPSPDGDPAHNDPSAGVVGKSWMTQRYAETYMNANLYSADDSAESLYEWQERGPYYLFDNNRDASDRSTRLITNTQYTPPVINANLLAFDHYRVQGQITIAQSRIVDVQVSMA